MIVWQKLHKIKSKNIIWKKLDIGKRRETLSEDLQKWKFLEIDFFIQPVDVFSIFTNYIVSASLLNTLKLYMLNYIAIIDCTMTERTDIINSHLLQKYLDDLRLFSFLHWLIISHYTYVTDSESFRVVRHLSTFNDVTWCKSTVCVAKFINFQWQSLDYCLIWKN